MWISSARILVNLFASISTVVLARLLVPADFGLVALGTTMLALVTAFTELSLTEALIKHQDPGSDHFSSAWTLNGTRGLIVFGLFAAAAHPAARFYEEPRLPPIMIALGLSVFINSLANPRRIVLQRNLVFWQEFVLSVSQKLAGLIAALTIAFVYHSYWALVIGSLATSLTAVIVSYCAVPFRPRITYCEARSLLSFSIWLTLGQAINMLNWRFDQLLVGKVLGRSALGLYTVGSTLSSLATREMTAPLTQTIYPGFSKLNGDRLRLRGAYQRAQALVTAVALPAGFGTAVIAEPAVRLFIGDKWLPAVGIMQALASIYALQTLGSLVEPLAMACGETRKLFVRSTQMFFVRVPIIVAAMYIGGLTGLVYARVFTGLFAAVVNMYLVKQLLGLRVADQLKANTRALISIVVMTAGAVLLLQAMGPQDGTFALIRQISFTCLTAAFLYLSTMVILWRLAGAPQGPETEILSIYKKLARKAA